VPVGEVAAPFGPAHDREEPHPLGVQPRPLLTRREVDVGGGPLARPVVLARGVVDAAVEPRAAQPVLQREVEAVADAGAPLFGRPDEEQPAERTVRLAPEGHLGLLLDDDDPPARRGQLGGGDEAGEPGAHHDDVGVHGARA
jgi:hypothetical protein